MFTAEKEGKTVIYFQNFDVMFFVRGLCYNVGITVYGDSCGPCKQYHWPEDDCPESLMKELVATDDLCMDDMVAMQAIEPGSKEFYEFLPFVIKDEENVKYILEHFLIGSDDEMEYFADDVGSLAIFDFARNGHGVSSREAFKDFMRMTLRELRNGKTKFDFPEGLRKEDYI
ncbi:MAG: hypothetical protein K6G36_01720 [Candidatus Saccharibacteria bacterium]|nr:hypothetical protein [Candidatus Saccharibacteria bacterium]